MSHRLYTAAKDAIRAYKDKRREELGVFEDEARAVGFAVLRPQRYSGNDADSTAEFVLMIDNGGKFEVSAGNDVGWHWHDVPRRHHRASRMLHRDLSEAQCEFMAWSGDWVDYLWPYWYGKTGHADIHSLIAFMKGRGKEAVNMPCECDHAA